MESAVLLIVYRRFWSAERVVASLRQAQPPRLYICFNAANPLARGDAEKVREVRQLLPQIDWDCELKILERELHLDVKNSVADAIDWFFSHEEEGIILEDDCVPHPDFYRFCDEMLLKYRRDDSVMTVSGSSFHDLSSDAESSYHFSKYPHIWGWATWRNAWKQYDRGLTFWPSWRDSRDWKNHFSDRVERKYWVEEFDKVFDGTIEKSHSKPGRPNLKLVESV